jgi:hypothetical protein
MFKGYLKKLVIKENKYITIINKVLTYIYTKFANNTNFIKKLVIWCYYFYKVVPEVDTKGNYTSFIYNLIVRRIKTLVTKVLKEVNKTSIYLNYYISIAIKILTFRYISLKGKGNPSINTILVKLNILYFNTSYIFNNTSTLKDTNIITLI